MGFYGNITNTTKTQFSFDRTYPNRVMMDANAATDGVYLGRYVLVEYDLYYDGDKELGKNYTEIYYDRNQGYTENDFEKITFYTDGNNFDAKNIVQYTETADEKDPYKGGNNAVLKGQIVRVKVDKNWAQVGNKGEYYILMQCIGPKSAEDKTAVFALISESDDRDPYVENFNIDVRKYGKGRGYDSTVWQKVYTNDKEKYVMIAELNAVVPTFDLTPDAPTLTPITPHFDTKSTSVYYNLHWQPQWGLKIKGEKKDSTGISIDENTYPSDEIVKYDYWKYDPDNDVQTQYKEEYNGAIYYNKAGFNKNTISNKSGEIEDSISILPTGQSGAKYNKHSNGTSYEIKPDTQEIKIMLPSLGNTIAEIWDIIYGNKEINNGNTRNLDINWDSTQGLRLIKEKQEGTGYEFDIEEVQTLAGCINSIHDLMGMIIRKDTTDDNSFSKEKWLEDPNAKNEIYYDGSNFYRVKSNYSFTEYEGDIKDTEEILYVMKNTGTYDFPIGSVWNKNVLERPEGIILGTRTDTPKAEILEGFARSMNTMHGALLRVLQALEGEDELDRNTNSLQGAINTIKDLIAKVSTLIPAQFVITNTYGQIQSSDWTTAQIFGYNNFGNGKSLDDEEPSENTWIYTDIDGTPDDPKITIEHRFTKVNDTETNSNKNIALKENENEETQTGLNKGAGDNLKLYTPIVDSMGHIVGKNIETVTLPFGFKTIITNGRGINTDLNDTTVPQTNNIVADNTQDSLAIDSGNKWIRIDTDINLDSLTISHDIHNISENSHETDWTKSDGIYTDDENIGTSTRSGDLAIPVTSYTHDEAGHLIKYHTETYKLPFGYGKIKGDEDSNTAATATYDELLFAGDKWLKATITEDTVTYTHKDPVVGTATEVNDVTPKFGEPFTITDYHFDDKGHKYANTDHTVTIPGLSLTPGTDGNVVTGISLIQNANDFGKTFIETKANIGNLVLTGYQKPTSVAAGILSTETLNVGLGKLEYKIDEEVGNRALAITSAISTAATDATSKANTAESNAKTYADSLIADLDVTDTAATGKYVSAVSEVNGKIEVSRAALPIYTLNSGSTNGTVAFNGTDVTVTGLGTAAYTDSNSYATAAQGALAGSALQLNTPITVGEGEAAKEETVENLLKIIFELQDRIAALEEQLNPSDEEPTV